MNFISLSSTDWNANFQHFFPWTWKFPFCLFPFSALAKILRTSPLSPHCVCVGCAIPTLSDRATRTFWAWFFLSKNLLRKVQRKKVGRHFRKKNLEIKRRLWCAENGERERAAKCKERTKLLIHENHVFLVFYASWGWFLEVFFKLSNLQSVLYKVMSCGRQSPFTVVFVIYCTNLFGGTSRSPEIFS